VYGWFYQLKKIAFDAVLRDNRENHICQTDSCLPGDRQYVALLQQQSYIWTAAAIEVIT
jgi:hypothetical protein